MQFDLQHWVEPLQPPPPVFILPANEQPPLFRALLGGDAALALELLQGGADALQALPGGVTALHAAALGGAAGALPALVAAGAAADAPLTARVQDPDPELSRYIPEIAPAGSTPLAFACKRSNAACVQALLAAGALCPPPVLDLGGMSLFPHDETSPWHWVARTGQHRVALRTALLASVLQRCATGALVLSPEQLMGPLVAAAMAPACTDELAAVMALPGAATLLSEAQRRRVASLVALQGDAAMLESLQEGLLHQHPLDPTGELLERVAALCCDDALPMTRLLLQARGGGGARLGPQLAAHPSLPCLLQTCRTHAERDPFLQHGTHTTLTAINGIVNQRSSAPVLELLLSSGLPLPAVPTGSQGEPINMWDGEYGDPEEARRCKS